MANIFILTTADALSPAAADKDANRLIALAIERLTTAAAVGGVVPAVASAEPVDVDARRAALFGQVTSGAMTMDDAVAALKALDVEVADQAKAAKADPPVCQLAGKPATAADVKRAFRGADSGTSVEVSSLDGSVTAGISMFRV
tara:strand:+ start:102 stop:533 length:432 start_codon:yes stop_codon:yes gene_type:complete